MGSEFVLILVIVAAVAFDFTNGFHDTANAMATSIATGALKPRVAAALSAVLNFVGAFISISVAATIAKGIVNPHVLVGNSGLTLVLAAIIGAMMWNLITWYFTIPSSSSHALIGGVIGATIVASSTHAINGHALVESVIVPGILSPLVAGAVALAGTFGAYRLMRFLGKRTAIRGYRLGQIGSASLVSLAHGTNDAQKTMGVISLALIAHGDLSAAHFEVPLWVKLVCATAMAAGTAIGGWRIINTMGNRITSLESPQGFAAESASASVILASSYFGYPLSTTQVVSGGVLGTGLGRRLAGVRWSVIGQMATTWTVTIPAAAVLAGAAFEISARFGTSSDTGALVIATLAVLGALALYQLAKQNNIAADDLDRTKATVGIEGERAEAAVAAAPRLSEPA